jgi:hypothetical protein
MHLKLNTKKYAQQNAIFKNKKSLFTKNIPTQWAKFRRKMAALN